jgi:hypothetical protein
LAEETEERKDHMKIVKSVNEVWFNNFNAWFRDLRFFTNPQFHLKVQELEKLEVERKEITAEEFPDMWAEILKVIPNTYVVEDNKKVFSGMVAEVDSETDKVIVGWVPSKYFKRNDGEV